MIVITIELWPGGKEELKKPLGTMKIINDGTGTQSRGNYKVLLSTWNSPNRKWREGKITGFPRKSKGPYDLIYRGLRKIVKGRNPDRVVDKK